MEPEWGAVGPKVYRSSALYPSGSPDPVVTIGNFDGVHFGHRALVGHARDLALRIGAKVCAYTFHPAPRDVLRPGNEVLRIQSVDDRVASLGLAGASDVVIEPFDLAFSSRSARWFVDEVLQRRLHAAAVVVGADFRFGKGRDGTVQGLREMLRVPVEVLDPVLDREGVISSSRIRQAVRSGRVDDAARLLGRPHECVGEVVHGDARGANIGFPTANLRTPTVLMPQVGVYAVLLVGTDGVRRRGVANLGHRPTFGGEELVLEVHVLDFNGDLYGQTVRVGFVKRIRGERTFDSAQALVGQIQRDVEAARCAMFALGDA